MNIGLTMGLLVGSLGLLMGCSDDGARQPPGGSSGPDSGVDQGLIDGGASDAALILLDAAMNSEGPLITIISPTVPADFEKESIITDEIFFAECKAEKNPNSEDRVDLTSVRISVVASDGQMFIADGQVTTEADVFKAILFVSDFPNGALEIRCTAKDTSDDAIANSASLATFLDLGPVVEISTPLNNSRHATSFSPEFTVTPGSVAPGDTQGGLMPGPGVVLEIAGEDLSSELEEPNGVQYLAQVNFDNALFPAALNGDFTLRVVATNERGVSRESTVAFIADGEGPSIEALAPTVGQLVGGIVDIEVDVRDPAGLQPGSVVASIDGGQIQNSSVPEVVLTQVEIGSTIYRGSFDSRVLDLAIIFPNLSIRAMDSLGNQSSLGYSIALDNVAPILSLDPPLLREAFGGPLLVDTELVCSNQFDPVGDDAVSDGDTLSTNLFAVRLRIEDHGNARSGAEYVPDANVDRDSVELFLFPAMPADLCINVNCGSQVCDPNSGDCADICSNTSCSQGTTCNPSTGECIADICSNTFCLPGTTCNPSTGECDPALLTKSSVVGPGGGFLCEINPSLVPVSGPVGSSDEVALYQMAELPNNLPNCYTGGGLAPFGADGAIGDTFAVSTDPGMGGGDFVDREGPNAAITCSAAGNNLAIPPLGPFTSLTRVIHTEFGELSEIYVIPQMFYPQCTGNAIDAEAINLVSGWVCLAARGSDRLGNTAISPAIRICTLPGGCTEPPGDCDDGCTSVDFPENEIIRNDFL